MLNGPVCVPLTLAFTVAWRALYARRVLYAQAFSLRPIPLYQPRGQPRAPSLNLGTRW